MTFATEEKTGALDQCHRCGGLLVPEQTGESGNLGKRCVICGERLDPVILAHRRQKLAREIAEKLFSNPNSSRLN